MSYKFYGEFDNLNIFCSKQTVLTQVHLKHIPEKSWEKSRGGAEHQHCVMLTWELTALCSFSLSPALTHNSQHPEAIGDESSPRAVPSSCPSLHKQRDNPKETKIKSLSGLNVLSPSNLTAIRKRGFHSVLTLLSQKERDT